MKYIGAIKNQNKLKAVNQKGEEKTYKCTAEVRKYAVENFKKNDIVKADFDKETWTITKLSKYQRSSGGGKGRGNYSPKDTDAINRQSAVKSASQALAGIAGVDVKNYRKIFEELIEVGYNFISASKKTETSSSSTKKDEVEEAVEEEEVVEEEEELE